MKTTPTTPTDNALYFLDDNVETKRVGSKKKRAKQVTGTVKLTIMPSGEWMTEVFG